MRIARARVITAVIGMMVVAASACAQSWQNFAIISMTDPITPKQVNGGICYSDISGSLVCDSGSGRMTTSGSVVFTNVSATALSVNGVNITGSVASSAVDRISSSGVASGAGLGAVVASYGTVSFTTGGTAGTAYLDTTGRYIGPGISITTLHGVSSTNGYFSGNVGVGTSAPTTRLHVVAPTPTLTIAPDSTFSNQNASIDLIARTSGSNQTAANISTLAWGALSLAANPSSGANSYIDFKTVGASQMRLNSNGRLGIGTTNPNASLHIQIGGNGTAPTTLSTTSMYINLGNGEYATNSYRLIGYGGNGSFPSAYMGYQEKFTGGYPYGDFIFGTRSQSADVAPLERMRIDTRGYVGISTAAPNATLDVAGLISSTNIYSGAASFTALTVNGVAITGNGTNNAVDRISSSGVVSGSGLGAVVTSYGTVSFTTGGTAGTAYLDTTGRYIGPGVSITSLHGVSSTNGYFSGNVGIGTTVPSSTLHVDGSGKTIRVGNSAVSRYIELYGGTVSSVGPELRLEGSNAWNVGAQLNFMRNGTSLWYSGLPSSVSLGDNFFIGPNNDASSAKLFIARSSGNVGVGMSTPSSTLHVSGTARITSNTVVSGTIQLSGTGDEGCTLTALGTIRIEPTTGRMQMCKMPN